MNRVGVVVGGWHRRPHNVCNIDLVCHSFSLGPNQVHFVDDLVCDVSVGGNGARSDISIAACTIAGFSKKVASCVEMYFRYNFGALYTMSRHAVHTFSTCVHGPPARSMKIASGLSSGVSTHGVDWTSRICFSSRSRRASDAATHSSSVVSTVGTEFWTATGRFPSGSRDVKPWWFVDTNKRWEQHMTSCALDQAQ